MSEKLLEISGLSVCYEGEQILNEKSNPPAMLGRIE